MKFKISFKKAENKLLAQVNDQYVVAGIIDEGVYSRMNKKPKKLRKLQGRQSAGVALYKGKPTTLELRGLMRILDWKRGIIRNALKNDQNDKDRLLEEFLNLGDLNSQTRKRRIENLATAIIKVPIMEKRYGRNSQSTIKSKGFDHWGVRTGTLFDNIKGRYYMKSN